MRVQLLIILSLYFSLFACSGEPSPKIVDSKEAADTDDVSNGPASLDPTAVEDFVKSTFERTSTGSEQPPNGSLPAGTLPETSPAQHFEPFLLSVSVSNASGQSPREGGLSRSRCSCRKSRKSLRNLPSLTVSQFKYLDRLQRCQSHNERYRSSGSREKIRIPNCSLVSS